MSRGGRPDNGQGAIIQILMGSSIGRLEQINLETALILDAKML